MMTKEQVLALADALVLRGESPRQYARRMGMPYSTLMMGARRVGVYLGVEVRVRRVALVVAEKQRTGLPLERLAPQAGFSSHSAFCRARKSLWLRWGRSL